MGEPADKKSEHWGQLLPIDYAQRFREDFREDQDEQGQNRRGNAEILIAEDCCCLCTHTRRPNGVRNGIGCENGSNRAVKIIARPSQRLCTLAALALK
jgi:hypothetical protein